MKYLNRQVPLAIVCLLGLSSCYATDSSSQSIKFIVLQECKSLTISRLDELSEIAMFEYRYYPFDFQFLTHSEVVGYVEIVSSVEGKEGLKYYAFDIEARCFPNAEKVISRDDREAGKKLIKFVESRERVGVEMLYIEVSKDELTIRWKQQKRME